MAKLAWGKKVSSTFCTCVLSIAKDIEIEPSWLMACMAFETGRTFSSSILNAAGSGAVGLLQFMPQTAAALGTSTKALAAMTAEQQLTVVRRYFLPYRKRLKSLGDVYGAIIWPTMIGRPDDYIAFDKADKLHPKRYAQNKGLDYNADGKITKAEIVTRVQKELDTGLLPKNAIDI